VNAVANFSRYLIYNLQCRNHSEAHEFDYVQTIQKLNTTQTQKSKCRKKNSTNKTSLVQSLPTTLGQEMRWAYSTTILSSHGALGIATEFCQVSNNNWAKNVRSYGAYVKVCRPLNALPVSAVHLLIAYIICTQHDVNNLHKCNHNF